MKSSSSSTEYFTLKQAKELFMRQDYFNGRIATLKTDLEKLLKTICYQQKRIKRIRYKYVFVGFRLNDESSEQQLYAAGNE